MPLSFPRPPFSGVRKAPSFGLSTKTTPRDCVQSRSRTQKAMTRLWLPVWKAERWSCLKAWTKFKTDLAWIFKNQVKHPVTTREHSAAEVDEAAAGVAVADVVSPRARKTANEYLTAINPEARR